MNRLTDRSKEIPLPCADNALFWARVHEKLARYEDTGLEPEKMRELLHDSTGPLHKKLGEWIDAEQEGRLVVLPRNVENIVYIVDRLGVLNGENQLSLFFNREDAEKALEGMKNDE